MRMPRIRRGRLLSVWMWNHKVAEHARQKSSFGWGGWSDFRRDEAGNDNAISDALWVVAIGKYIVFGLDSLVTFRGLLPLLFLRRVPARWWLTPHWSANSSSRS